MDRSRITIAKKAEDESTLLASMKQATTQGAISNLFLQDGGAHGGSGVPSAIFTSREASMAEACRKVANDGFEPIAGLDRW
jgi:hypothetical protein